MGDKANLDQDDGRVALSSRASSSSTAEGDGLATAELKDDLARIPSQCWVDSSDESESDSCQDIADSNTEDLHATHIKPYVQFSGGQLIQQRLPSPQEWSRTNDSALGSARASWSAMPLRDGHYNAFVVELLREEFGAQLEFPVPSS